MITKQRLAGTGMLLAWLALGLSLPLHAHAQQALPSSQGTPAFIYGGGIPNPNPPVLTAAERSAVAHKVAARDALSRQPVGGSGGASPFYQYGNWWYSNNYKLEREPLSGYPQCGTSATPNPPNGCAEYDSYFYGNLCGPGSTTFIDHVANPSAVDNFTNGTWGNGWYGFLNRSAYYGMVFAYDSRQGKSVWGTYWTSEKYWINQNESADAYISDPCDSGANCNTTSGAPRYALSYSTFNSDLQFDIYGYGLATMAAVDTAGLGNWTYGGVDHLISVNGWDPTDGQIKYSDTGNDSGMTSGTYQTSETYFYYNALQGNMAEKMVLW